MILLQRLFVCLLVVLSKTISAETSVTFTLFDNGKSDGGIDVTLSSDEFPESSDADDAELQSPGEAFAMEMSELIEVSKYKAPKPVVATRAYREDGELVTEFRQLEPGGGGEKRRVYLVAEGLDFVWPFIELGHMQVVSPNVLPSPEEGKEVIIESVSERPRVFKVFHMFTADEATGIMENAMNLTGINRLKRSTVGSGKDEDGEDIAHEDRGRTSSNAWDHESPGAKAMITRSFQLTNIEENAGKRDGLQVVQYQPGQGYNTHPDYFTAKDDDDFDFHPYSGGSNRFATVFMYLNDVEEGGNTVFPRAPGVVPESDPPQYALDMFKSNTWEKTLTKQCYSKLAVPPVPLTAALFYSVTPDGQIDPSSHHGACPVIRGMKWGANIWIWNRQRYGEVRTGGPRSLLITNNADETIYISWERKPSGTIKPGVSMNMDTFEYHRFKASFGSHKEKPISEFTTQSEPDNQVWVIKQPRHIQRKTQEKTKAAQAKVLVTNLLKNKVHIFWEGRELFAIDPKEETTMNSFENHIVRASLGSEEEAFDEFKVTGEEHQTWEIRNPTINGGTDEL